MTSTEWLGTIGMILIGGATGMAGGWRTALAGAAMAGGLGLIFVVINRG